RTEQSLIIRFARPDRIRSHASLLTEMHSRLDTARAVTIPRPVLDLSEQGLLVMEHMPGRTASEEIRKERTVDLLERLAKILAVLHTMSAEGLPELRRKDFLSRAKRMCQQLRTAGGDNAEMAETVLLKLFALADQLSDGPTGMVHGDYHAGQVLIHEGQCCLLDFDRTHFGDTIADIGSFLAQLELLHCRGKLDDTASIRQPFLTGYEQKRGHSVNRSNLSFWVCWHLIELALREYRRLKPTWPDRVRSILQRTDMILERAKGDWL
ncbi:MAG: phosphotransferase family protein, partial [Candidatus Zixiibacteriota bacterium]